MPSELIELMYVHDIAKSTFMETALTFLLYGSETFFYFYGLKFDRETLTRIYHAEAFK